MIESSENMRETPTKLFGRCVFLVSARVVGTYLYEHGHVDMYTVRVRVRFLCATSFALCVCRFQSHCCRSIEKLSFVRVEVSFHEKRTNTIANLPSPSCVFGFAYFYLYLPSVRSFVRLQALHALSFAHHNDTNKQNTFTHRMTDWLTGCE